MSTHKHLDKICCVVLAVTLLLTVLFMNAESFGVQKSSTVMGYENKLFDTSKVHTIDIIMDDWDEFTSNCKNEEYYACSVVIDNEAFKNVAIRGKGNTSLSLVSSYGNDRYSFKIEFDHYDSTNTYYGLDKLCLNNIIQDNTYMKDYLSYQMMAEMGVASPLCSYIYITVNGEDWGLYLAVEAVEESFLQRNYGNNYGEIYKPDSQSMGGGRGNGEKFDMNEFFGNDTESQTSNSSEATDNTIPTEETSENTTQAVPNLPNGEAPVESDGRGQVPDNMQNGQMPDNMQGGQMMQDGQMPGNMQGGQMMQDGQMPGNMPGDQMQGDATPPELPNGETAINPNDGNMQGNITPPNNTTTTDNSTSEANGSTQQDSTFKEIDKQSNDGDKGSMSSDDVLLKYIDDEFESYSNIFNNAKTDISDSDKERLIEALEKLSNGEDLENTIDIEKVISYFVVHNFVLNFDSYTGSMIHNYYLYENGGQMQMVPWDYNLAFGSFAHSSNATELVNYPIDSPVSSDNIEDRPMISWIFASEEYTELYHEYFAKFISEYFDSGYFEEMINNVSSMISPYVEKDPTKFCTYEEFEAGVSTLKEFCLLRAESITGQLNGTIGSTSDTQSSDTLIDAEDIQISDMGSHSINNSEQFGDNKQSMQDDVNNSEASASSKSNNDDITSSDNSSIQMQPSPEKNDSKNSTEDTAVKQPNDESFADNRNPGNDDNQMQKPDEKGINGEMKQMGNFEHSTSYAIDLIQIVISIGVLVLGLGFALFFKRRK